MGNNLDIVYLLRYDKNWILNSRIFFRSYLNHKSGVNHSLHIILKGFDQNNINVFKNLFKIDSFQIYIIDDYGFDLNSYYNISLKLQNEYVFFFNSYSEINYDNWLYFFLYNKVENNSEFIGATGSYESLNFRLPFFSFKFPSLFFIFIKKLFSRLLNYFTTNKLKTFFPSPHIRTNSFLVNRYLFIEYFKRYGEPISKKDCIQIESGTNSLTNFFYKNGYNPGIVNSKNQFFTLNNLHNAKVFRSYHQKLLLISDNRTREYSFAKDIIKRSLMHDAWNNFIDEI